jgi:hypothetical protein
MLVYVGKDRRHIRQDLTATHAIVTELTNKVHGRGYKLYMENYFTSPILFDDEADLLLWHCQTPHEMDATGLRPQKN